MRTLKFVLALAMLAIAGVAQADVKFAYVGEISGSIAVSGGNFRDGVILAVEEINAKGGILRQQDRRCTHLRHADQSRRRALADAEGDRRRSLRRSSGRSSPATSRSPCSCCSRPRSRRSDRRRGGRADQPGRPLPVPHLVRPADRHAEDRQLHPRRAEGQDGRADLGEQRLRQGRPRQVHQGDGRAQHQGRRRRLDRVRPGRLRRRRRQAQGRQRRRGLRLHATRRRCARILREARKQGLKGPLDRRDHAAQPEDDRARRRCRQRRAGPCRPHRRRADPGGAGVRARSSRSASTTSPTTTASRATPRVYAVKYVTEKKLGKFDRKALAKTMHGLTITPEGGARAS